MNIRECPRDNQPLVSETRVIHHPNPNAAYNRAHPHNPMIGGVLMPSRVEFLVCPVCKWECEAREYDNAIGEFWALHHMFERIKSKEEKENERPI